MRKQVLLLAASFLMLGACTKVKTDETNTQSYVLVNFAVNGLKTEVEEITRSSTNTAELSKYFTTLHYFGYSNNKRIFNGTHTTSDNTDDFGEIAEQIPTGSYYIGFFGYGEGIGNTYIYGAGESIGDNDYIETSGTEIWYYEDKYCNIDETTTNIDVNMTRKTGRITLNITDAVPDNVSRISISIGYRNRYRITYGDASVLSTWGSYTNDLDIIDGDVGEFEFNCFPSSSSSVKIDIYDSNDTILDSRSMSIDVFENRKTIITGELFSNVNSKEFTITISDAWGEDNIVELK
ncbi:MAG: hypothetical protein SNH99_01930 [Rikenellaceae bacterium]